METSELTPAMIARFWMNAKKRGGCWLWEGAMTKGYGTFAPRQFATLRAHRVAYELLAGPIPEGLDLDHLCKNTACINPQHLEPVTHAENCRRGDGFGGRNARKVACKYGHPLSGENLYVDPKGRRQCRTCRAESGRAFRARNPDYSERFKDRRDA